jgi:hypothetical protein
MTSEALFIECKKCHKSTRKSSFTCQHCGARKIRLKPLHWVGIVLLTLVLIGNLSSPDNPSSSISMPAENVTLSPTKTDIFDKIELDFSWSSGRFGSIMMADFTIKNTSKLDIKDIGIRCDHFSKSETKIDSNTREVYEIFKANSQKHFPDFNMGFIHSQANSSSCYIKDFKLVE